LKYAKSLGYKVKVLESYVYKPRNIFSDIIAQYNTLKQSSDTGLRQIGKLLMNSLFGKFAQKPILSYSFIISSEKLAALKDEIKSYDEGIHTPMSTYELEAFNAKKRIITQEEKIGDSDLYLITIKGGKDTIGQVEDKRSTRKTQSAIPIISAFISAYARIFLHQNIMKFDPLYVDTDSLVVTKPLPEDIVDPKKLGLFKLEKKGIEFIALNLKRYALKMRDGEEVNKMSGSKHPLSFEEYLAIYAKLSPEYIPPTRAISQERSFIKYTQGTVESRVVNTTFEFNHDSRLPLYELCR
jgi:DNA polymerase type B, organellar and viral